MPDLLGHDAAGGHTLVSGVGEYGLNVYASVNQCCVCKLSCVIKVEPFLDNDNIIIDARRRGWNPFSPPKNFAKPFLRRYQYCTMNLHLPNFKFLDAGSFGDLMHDESESGISFLFTNIDFLVLNPVIIKDPY